MDTADISKFQTEMERQPKPKPELPAIHVGQGQGGHPKIKPGKRKRVHKKHGALRNIPPELMAIFEKDYIIKRLRRLESRRLKLIEKVVSRIQKRIEAARREIYNTRHCARLCSIRDRMVIRQRQLAAREADRLCALRKLELHRQFGISGFNESQMTQQPPTNTEPNETRKEG